MDLKSLNRAVEQIAQEKGIAPEVVLEAVESSIAAAYRKEYAKKGEFIKAKMSAKTGELKTPNSRFFLCAPQPVLRLS